MCFRSACNAKAAELAKRYGVPEISLPLPMPEVNAFAFPLYPVVSKVGVLSAFHWGLVPSWVKTHDEAKEIRAKTLNARAETVAEKPSFKNGFKHHRCLIPMTSFFEWQHLPNGATKKFELSTPGEHIFSVAGIWDSWTGPKTGKEYFGFSVLTCEANPLMAEIHNTKKRMPVILQKEQEIEWIERGSTELLVAFPHEQMRASAIT